MNYNPKFQIGSTVRNVFQREIVGTVKNVTYSRGIHWYQIIKLDGRNHNCAEQDLELFTPSMNTEDNFIEKAFSTRESFSRVLTYNKLVGGYLNNPTSFMSLKTIFKPHQYKPLLKFLYSGNQRLLIADEVGLGKTIEAGYILSELNSKSSLRFVLVVCPKSLCIKWKRELSEKFSFYFEIFSKNMFLNILDEYERGYTGRRVLGIISYQTARSIDVRDRLREVNPAIDLIIFDEMHWTRNETSQTNRLARILSELADSVIGLTATPVMIGSNNLYNLLNILNPFEFQSERDFSNRLEDNKFIIRALNWIGRSKYDLALEELNKLVNSSYTNHFNKSPLFLKVLSDLQTKNETIENTVSILKDATELSMLSHVVTRTRRKEVELKCIRRAQTIKLEFTEIEKHFYNTVTNFIRQRYSEYDASGRGMNFAILMPQRQIASCIPAMIKNYLPIEEFVKKLTNEDEIADLIETNNEHEEINEEARNKISQDISKLLATISENPFAIPDSKYDELRKVLQTIFKQEEGSKVLIFTYFRGTLEYLSNKLKQDGFSIYTLSGSVDSDLRQEMLDKFRNENNVKIMISTEVGSEGIDLEFCTTLVNYDLPWNPMVVEQRIGRLDRFGQKAEAISIINFAVEETIEARILERLYERIRIFEESIGDLESILGEEIKKLSYELLSKKLTKEEEENRIDRVAEVALNERMYATKLEEESAGLITNDEYFHRELESILSEKRFITHEELFIYIKEFLNDKYPDCIINLTEREKVYTFYFSDNLEIDIKNISREMNLFDENLSVFLNRANRLNNRTITITFDNELARTEKSLEMINPYHPLVRYITEKIKKESTYLNPCAAVSLERYSNLKKGIYFYFTYELNVSGGKTYKSLTHIIIDNDNNEALSEHPSAELMAEILIRGKSYDFRNDSQDYNLKGKYSKANDIYFERLDKIERELKIVNESNVQKQIDIIQKVYDNRIEKIQETIYNVRYDDKKKRIIPALEGQVDKFKKEKQIKLNEIMSKKDIHTDFRLIAAGILKIEGE